MCAELKSSAPSISTETLERTVQMNGKFNLWIAIRSIVPTGRGRNLQYVLEYSRIKSKTFVVYAKVQQRGSRKLWPADGPVIGKYLETLQEILQYNFGRAIKILISMYCDHEAHCNSYLV